MCTRKCPYECVHSVRIELAKLILVGTRITYQATGDAGWVELLKKDDEVHVRTTTKRVILRRL